MKRMRLPIKIVKTLVKDRMYHPDRLIADTVILATRCGVLLVLYAYIFKLKGGEINGAIYSVAAWSMFLYFIFSMLGLREIARLITQDVKSGNVEILFSKPISYLGYRVWWQIGSGLYSFLVTTILGTAILAFAVGIPKTMQITLFSPSLFLIFIGSIFLSLVLYGIVGLLAFWIEETNPVFWVVDKTVMILGGAYLPVALFPDFMYKFAVYSPFGASRFMSHTVYESWGSNWLMFIGIQFFWIFLLVLIAWMMFIKARKKISINGG